MLEPQLYTGLRKPVMSDGREYVRLSRKHGSDPIARDLESRSWLELEKDDAECEVIVVPLNFDAVSTAAAGVAATVARHTQAKTHEKSS